MMIFIFLVSLRKRLVELFFTHYRKKHPQRCPDVPKYPELHYQLTSLVQRYKKTSNNFGFSNFSIIFCDEIQVQLTDLSEIDSLFGYKVLDFFFRA